MFFSENMKMPEFESPFELNIHHLYAYSSAYERRERSEVHTMVYKQQLGTSSG